MAPTRSKKQRKSTESAGSVDIQSFPAPPQMVPTKMRSPATTPPNNRSPIRKPKMGITAAQRQALIDNLQLEITERARKLRAQYTMQAQQLKTRIEIRVNRIPVALRKAKMGDLLLKYSETASKPAASTYKVHSPAKNLLQAEQSRSRASPSPNRGTKRLSVDMDKENEDIENPKKRTRAAPVPPARTTSRAKIAPSQVLSPRSANSRTLPRSPIARPISPQKSFLARPVSPLKPVAPAPAGGAAGILTNMVEKAKTTRATVSRKVTAESSTTGAGRGRRAAPPASAPKIGKGRASTISESSDSSSTTVVRKPVPAKKAPAKKTMMSTIKGMGSQKKMPAAAKSTASAAPVSTGRVLRKRN
ncbi:uncharacterized protein LY89DRAFT_786968 [Mollisia scopiformis]|uniref:Borealin N-terminal domain-containing protein n=1 Tax=Mollisia scopiformis TaxID=149040 RepID=A0A194WUL3_MOLSC|nr:uncharacterized protein LY89DRAFT_786968 [Mollisia scopiformis]KUJ11359.1 hypothetical protein LY89DRAFT_786968 [Mollisia scopiformis]